MKRNCLPILFAVTLLFSFFALPVSADEAEEPSGATEMSDGDWYYGKPIRSVSFKGLKHTDSKDVDGVSSGFIGEMFTDEVYQNLLDRIYAIDLFDEIEPQVSSSGRGNTVDITFVVKEKPSVRRILVTGNRQVRTAEIKDAVSMKEKEIFIAGKLAYEERAIRSLYLEKGFTNVKVSSSTKETEKGIDVLFTIDEGRATVITEIKFTGTKAVSAKTLKKKIRLKEAGFLSKGAFQESMLEIDKKLIALYYQNIGYIDVKSDDVTKTVTPNEEKRRDELTITFHIQEGERYTYSGIEFSGNEIFSDEELLSKMKIQPGAVFNITKFQESLTGITDLYYENGYTANRFRPVENKDSENKTVSYTFIITENSRSHVESVSIKGNNKTKEHVITREIPIQVGDIFSKTKIETGLRNLRNLQYFSNVDWQYLPGSEENLVDLVFNVDEQSTTSVEFGVTFSGVSDPDELPFALFAKWQDSNIRGSGRSVGVSSTIATNEQSMSLSLSENWFLGLPLSASVSTEISHSNKYAYRLSIAGDGTVDDDSYYMQYERWKWALGFSVGRRWTPDWAIISLAGGVNGSLLNNIYDSELWIPVDTSVSEYANNWGWQNSVWASFSVDDRNINYNPSRGWFASERLTWYGLTPIETEFFLKTDTKLEKYFTLFDINVTESWNFKAVLMGYSNLALLFPAPGSGIGDSSKLYIDGMFNGRGWTDIYNKVRGKAAWNNTVELRVPVIPNVLALDWFGDAAVIKDSPDALFHDLSVEDFYFSTGPGVRFLIPQFPLRLLFANTFRIEDGSISWEDKWQFVLSFVITNR